ncbi:MAG: PAS domain S-box protein [Candidatus Acidiferrales bacterium]
MNTGSRRDLVSSWVTAIMRTLCLILLLGIRVSAQSNEPKKVLILTEEDNSRPSYRVMDENARTTLRAGLPGRIVIFGEHLDRIPFPDPRFQAEQSAGIQRKYANSKIDLVIGVGDVPTDLFPGVPFLYVRTDPSQKRPSSPASSRNLSNVWIALDAQKTLDAARRLQPKARQVVVIGSSSATGRNLFDQVRDQIEADPHHLPITYLTNQSFSEISQKIAALGPESIVLFVSLSQDARGGQFISAEIISKLAAVSGAPVYVLLDTHVGSGAVGGYVVRFAEIGKQAGEMGLQMLAGASPSDATARSGYLFDWRELRRWKIPESALPPGSVVLNRLPSAWETYRGYIISAILLCLLETLLILGLLWQRAKRRKVEASLLASLTFEQLLADLSTTFINLPEEQITGTIENSLGRIAEFLGIERMGVHEFSRERMEWTPTITWRKEGVQPAAAVVRPRQLPWWTNYFLRGDSMFISEVNELPEEAALEREYLRRIGAISVALVPLKAGDELHGCISFVSTQREVSWTDELKKQLQLLGEIFSNALERKSAKDARSRHTAIVESSDDAIISKDLSGIILSWNAAAQRLFGFSEAEAVGQPITIIFPPELYDEETNILERLRAGEHIVHYETTRVTKGGQKIDVSLTISPVKDSTGRIAGFSKIARDISDRKRAEQTLRESEERFRLVANKAPVLIWMSGTDKLCTFFNQCWLDFSGRTMEQELGNGWAAGVHPEDLERCLGTYTAAFDAQVDFEMEYRLKRFDGTYRWIVDYGVPRFESDGAFCGYIGSCVDITDRKLTTESLEELSGRLITAQDQERTRIARELHDDFSQRLALQGIGLAQLWKKLPESEVEDRAKVQQLMKGLQEIASDMHSLSHQLHSSKLEHVGLVPALSGLCEELSSRFKIQIEFSQQAISSGIPKDIALCVFRIAQEALGNVIKHSGAKQAHAELYGTQNEIRLRVVDTGLGFDPALRNGDAGLGLISMRERLRLVGGTLSVQSAPMRGTEILAAAPLSASARGPREREMAMGTKN